MTKPRLSHWNRTGITLVGSSLDDFFWQIWVKYVSDPSTSEPCGSFAQDDRVGERAFLQGDCSWEVPLRDVYKVMTITQNTIILTKKPIYGIF